MLPSFPHPPRHSSSPTWIAHQGQTPRLRLELKTKPKQNEVALDVDVDEIVLDSPQLCMGDPQTTRLHLELELKSASSATPLTLAQVQDWECVTRRDGTLRQLRPAGNPALTIER